MDVNSLHQRWVQSRPNSRPQDLTLDEFISCITGWYDILAEDGLTEDTYEDDQLFVGGRFTKDEFTYLVDQFYN